MVSRKAAREKLKGGGHRIFEARATIYDRNGYNEDGTPRLDQQTGARMFTGVHQILDPRLKLTDTQRAVGNCFGAYADELMSGGAGEFMREYVDRTPMAASGITDARVHKSRMIQCAMTALNELPAFKCPRGTTRSGAAYGPHRKIKPFHLISAVCIHQRTLAYVAITYGWTRSPVQDGKFDRPAVPVRQRHALADALRASLDAIKDGWDIGGYAVPYQFYTVVVR